MGWGSSTSRGGVKNFGMSLATEGRHAFWRDVPGNFPGYPGGAQKVREEKCLCSIFVPYLQSVKAKVHRPPSSVHAGQELTRYEVRYEQICSSVGAKRIGITDKEHPSQAPGYFPFQNLGMAGLLAFNPPFPEGLPLL